MDNGDADWNPVIDLIERVTGDRDLLPSVVAGVSASVREVSVLPPADIAGHTRALLAAATRAIAARRGPTEAELSFVAELGVRSEEHTSELQSRENLVCRLLLEKKK